MVKLLLVVCSGPVLHTFIYPTSAMGASAAGYALLSAFLSTATSTLREYRAFDFDKNLNLWLPLKWLLRFGALCAMIVNLGIDFSMNNSDTSVNSTQLGLSAEGVPPSQPRPPPSPWAHIGGAIAGFLVGLNELRWKNGRSSSKFRTGGAFLLVLFALIVHI